MIDARDLDDVLDVIGDHRERDAGLRMRALPFSQCSGGFLGLADEKPTERRRIEARLLRVMVR